MGLPRCGSTLIEKTIVETISCSTVGEAPVLATQISNVVDRNKKSSLSSAYEDYLGPSSTENFNIVIDKNLYNFSFAKLILNNFENSKIIWMERNPQDQMWSNYEICYEYGLNDHTSNFHSMMQIIDYYNKEKKAFVENQPSRNLLVNFDEFLKDVDKETNKIFDFIGLKQKSKNQRMENFVTLTHSANQINRPIKDYGKWKLYRSFIPEKLRSMIEQCDVRN